MPAFSNPSQPMAATSAASCVWPPRPMALPPSWVLGESIVRAVGGPVLGLKIFQDIAAWLVKLPTTPIDLLVWLRARPEGIC